MKKFFEYSLLFLYLFGMVSVYPCYSWAGEGILWQTNFEQAMQQARQENKPVLVHFSADFCGPCKLIEKEVFPDSEIIQNINQNFIPVKIDTEKDQATTKKFGVTGIPADIFVSPNGEVISQRVGKVNAQQYLGEIRKICGLYRPNFMSPVASAQQQSQLLVASPPRPPEQLERYGNTLSYENTRGSAPSDSLSAQRNEPIMGLGVGMPLGTATVVNRPVSQPTFSTGETSPIGEPSISRQTFPESMSAESMPTSTAQSALPVSLPTSSLSFPQEKHLLFDGYCPVTLTEELRWVKGNPQFSTEFENGIFYFVSQEAQQRFLTSPHTFAPIASGTDVVEWTLYKKKVVGSRKYGAWYHGNIYLFVDKANYEQFQANPHYFAGQVNQLSRLVTENRR